MVSCCVCGTTAKPDQAKTITFHTFPRDPVRRRKWIEFTNKGNWEPTARNVVCSKHFENKYFDRMSSAKIRLKPDAVPTLVVDRLKYVKFPTIEVVKPAVGHKPNILRTSNSPKKLFSTVRCEVIDEKIPKEPKTSETTHEEMNKEPVTYETVNKEDVETPKKFEIIHNGVDGLGIVQEVVFTSTQANSSENVKETAVTLKETETSSHHEPKRRTCPESEAQGGNPKKFKLGKKMPTISAQPNRPIPILPKMVITPIVDPLKAEPPTVRQEAYISYTNQLENYKLKYEALEMEMRRVKEKLNSLEVIIKSKDASLEYSRIMIADLKKKNAHKEQLLQRVTEILATVLSKPELQSVDCKNTARLAELWKTGSIS